MVQVTTAALSTSSSAGHDPGDVVPSAAAIADEDADDEVEDNGSAPARSMSSRASAPPVYVPGYFFCGHRTRCIERVVILALVSAGWYVEENMEMMLRTTVVQNTPEGSTIARL